MRRADRLRGRSAFAAVRARRIASGSGPLRVSAAPNSAGLVRVGLVVPAAVGGAVVRNRLRRRLRAALTPLVAGLGGVDLVIGASADAAALDYPALRAHLERALTAATGRLPAAPPVEENGGRRPLAPRSISHHA